MKNKLNELFTPISAFKSVLPVGVSCDAKTLNVKSCFLKLNEFTKSYS